MGGSSTTLSIVLKLIDDASGALKSTASSFQDSLKQLEPALKTTAVASGAAFAAITGEIYAATNAARDDIEIHKQLQAVLKSTGGVAGVTAEMADRLANAMQDVSNYDNDAVLSMENILLTFTNINKDIFPQTTELTMDIATAMHEDLKDAAIQVGKALQDPVLGMTALRRVGVNFSEDQIKVVKSLVDTGQTAKAQAIILTELQREFGGSARATADPVIQLNNAIGDMQKEIGKALIPVLNQVVEVIKPVVMHVMEWVDAHPKLTAAILIGAAAVAGLVLVLSTLGLAIIGISALFTTLMPLVIAVGGVIAALGAPILLIIGLFGLLAYFTISHWNDIKLGAETIWEGITNVIKSAVDYITGIVQGMFDTVMGIVNKIISAIHSVSGAVSSVAGAAGGAASGVLHAIVPHLASGGIVTSPTLALIGEAGPEAVVPLGSGGVGGITINITGNTISSSLDVRGIAEAVSAQIVRTLRMNQKLTV